MTRFRMFKATAAALLALALIGPIGASAATPLLAPTFTALPSSGVQDGELVALRSTIRNDDSSTVSQLFLVELTRSPRLTFISVATSQGTCTGSATTLVSCTLGQLKPHKTAKVTAIYRTDVVAAQETEYLATGTWEFNTVGLGSGGGDNSHGDKWSSGPLTARVTSDDDLAGSYVVNPNLLTVENNQALNNANPHSTKAFVPATEIGVSVEDIDCTLATPDPICATFTGGFGQVSKVNVNEGIDVSGTPLKTLLHFYIQLDASEIQSGANANNVNITHTYVDEVTGDPATEPISARCTFVKKATTPSTAPCISVRNLPGGDLGIDIWTFHNGGFKPNL